MTATNIVSSTSGPKVSKSRCRYGKSWLVVAPLAVHFASVGCTPTQLPLDFHVLERDASGGQPITQQLMLVADNQQQYLYGKPVWIRTALVDHFVASAIRAPQLDLFGPSMLEWIVDTYSSQFPLVHLGDGLNLSCAQEFTGFVRTMNRAQFGWFMAPGNHDGIYFGSSGADGEWARVCDGKHLPKGPFDKADFVRGYLDNALTPRPAIVVDSGVEAFAAFRKRQPASPPRQAPVVRWDYGGRAERMPSDKSAPGWLRRVAYRIDTEHAYRSFVAQELDVTLQTDSNPIPARYILLDTADYEYSPELIPVPPHVNAGATGSLSRAQLDVVESWLKEIQELGSEKARPVIVLLGHHPFAALTRTSREALDRLRRDYGVLLYVSAHTHKGDYFVHEGEGSGWLELNIGSTVDWPVEYREFSVNRFVDAKGVVHIYTQATLNEIDRLMPKLNCDVAAWQPQLDDRDYYVDYVAHKGKAWTQTAALVFDSLLASYERLLGIFPSAADNTEWPVLDAEAPRDNQAVSDLIKRVREQAANEDGINVKRAFLEELEDYDRERKLGLAPASAPPLVGPGSPAGAPVNPAAGGSEVGTLAPTAPAVPPSAVDSRTRHRDYRLCQAIWASRDDETGARRARRKDWYISYPTR